jgi:hypothetical protein
VVYKLVSLITDWTELYVAIMLTVLVVMGIILIARRDG